MVGSAERGQESAGGLRRHSGNDWALQEATDMRTASHPS